MLFRFILGIHGLYESKYLLKSSFGRSNCSTSVWNVSHVLSRDRGQNAVVSETIGWSMGLCCVRPFSRFKLPPIILYWYFCVSDGPTGPNDRLFLDKLHGLAIWGFTRGGCSRMNRWFLMHLTTHTCHSTAYFVHFMHQLCMFIASTCWIICEVDG